MRILLVEPERVPVEKEIHDDLKEMQDLVGGCIQVLYPFEDEVGLVCNEEGKLMHLPANRVLRDHEGKPYDLICGTFFLVGTPTDSENFESLTQEQVERYSRLYRIPELFILVAGQLVCLPMEIKNPEGSDANE